jgi:xanthine/CO dehydrogenase XdhC/CoxF family maturation factor
MTDINAEVMELARQAAPAAVATIVRTKGSTPREVGARMIVRADGQIRGTVGGGCGEADVWSAAMEVLAQGTPKLVEVDLLHDGDDEGGRACGGIMYVYIERLEGPAPVVGQSPTGIDGNE